MHICCISSHIPGFVKKNKNKNIEEMLIFTGP